MDDRLRPIERVIRRLHQERVPIPEIALKVGKRPGTVERILRMIDFKTGEFFAPTPGPSRLRAIERVVLRLRASGETYGEIGNRLGRSGAHIRRIEAYSRLKTS